LLCKNENIFVPVLIAKQNNTVALSARFIGKQITGVPTSHQQNKPSSVVILLPKKNSVLFEVRVRNCGSLVGSHLCHSSFIAGHVTSVNKAL
jgi:hypothetical protein